MKLTFALPDGTCAEAMLAPGLSNESVAKGTPCSAPDEEVPVVFHIPNKQTLDRVMTRFATAER